MQVIKVIDHIIDWLKGYCNNAGMQGFVAGVSGGIDSAVTSTLCAKTGKKTIVLNLPIYQAKHQISLADQHIAWLKKNFNSVKGIKVDLTRAVDALAEIFPQEIQEGLVIANTHSRMRMVAHYAFATHHRMLVVGTGNKVEDFGVGFFTKYGDGGVDISPIADLSKSEVYAIGKELDIHDAILKAPPTDGLWVDNRTDESQIGASYPELEWALQIEANPRDEDQLDVRQKEVLAIYRKFHNANKHKMLPIPVCEIPDALR